MVAYEDKKAKLIEMIRELRAPAIAYSGGVDSAVITSLSFRLHPHSAVAFFITTPYIDPADKAFAFSEGARNKWHLEDISPELFDKKEISHNKRTRCYVCKKEMLSAIYQRGTAKGCLSFLEGSNSDDAAVFRPGRRAVAESVFCSPLAECDFTKKDVRCLAEELGLASCNKPSKPCLLTRFPYDVPEEILLSDLERIKTGEHHLASCFRDNFRLRWVDKDTARVEASLYDRFAFSGKEKELFADIPFTTVFFDKEPFQSGSFDRKKGESR